MTVIHIHEGGGCEAIVRSKGNELTDLEVHQYLCPKAPTHTVVFPRSGSEKEACDEHAARWKGMFNGMKVRRHTKEVVTCIP